MKKTMTLAALKAGRPLHYVQTMYGEDPIGLRPLSTRVAMRLRGEAGKEAPLDPEEVNRLVVSSSVADPKLDEEGLAALENDAPAYLDLIQQILAFNGMTPAAQRSAARDFRDGDSEPGGVPAGS